MEKTLTRNLVLAGLFIAIGLILPFITGQIPEIGRQLLPMHIPVLIAGFVLGWKYGLVVGLIVPILRSLLFTMPHMFPTAVAMSFELAAYGCLTGLLYNAFPKKNGYIYATLILSMLGGRVIWGIVSLILYGFTETAFTWKAFMAGAFVNAIPGIIIQIIIIPILIMALERSNLIEKCEIKMN
jgi:riboflavin transporter FmnP